MNWLQAVQERSSVRASHQGDNSCSICRGRGLLLLATVCLLFCHPAFGNDCYLASKSNQHYGHLVLPSRSVQGRTTSVPYAFVSHRPKGAIHSNQQTSKEPCSSQTKPSVVSSLPKRISSSIHQIRHDVACQLFFKASDSKPGRRRQEQLTTLAPPPGTLDSLSRSDISLPYSIPLLPKEPTNSTSSTATDESYSLTIRPMKVSDLSDEILPMCVKEFGTGPTASISELLDAEIWEKANTGSLIDWWERLWLEPMVSLTLQTKIWLQESRSQSAAGNGQSIFGDHTLLVLCLNSHKHSQYSNDETNNQERSQGNLGTQDAEGEVIGMIELSLQPPEASRNPPFYPIPTWMKLVYSEIHHLDGLQGWITNLLIDPDHRGRGYGKILVAAVEGITKALQKDFACHSICLHADANGVSGRIPQALYEGMGYDLVRESRSMGNIDSTDSSSSFDGMNMYFDSKIQMIDGGKSGLLEIVLKRSAFSQASLDCFLYSPLFVVPLLFYRKRLIGRDD